MKNGRLIKLGPVLLFVLMLVLSAIENPPAGPVGDPFFRFFVLVGVSFLISSMLGFVIVYVSLIQGIAVTPQIFYAYCISLFGSIFFLSGLLLTRNENYDIKYWGLFVITGGVIAIIVSILVLFTSKTLKTA